MRHIQKILPQPVVSYYFEEHFLHHDLYMLNIFVIKWVVIISSLIVGFFLKFKKTKRCIFMNNTFEDLKNLLINFFVNNNISPEDAFVIMRDVNKAVVEKLLEKQEGFFVIKKSGHIEKFDEQKLSISIANASDDIKEPLTTGDISNIVRTVVHKLEETHKKLVDSSKIRSIVLETLMQFGFEHVYANYKYYEKNQPV